MRGAGMRAAAAAYFAAAEAGIGGAPGAGIGGILGAATGGAPETGAGALDAGFSSIWKNTSSSLIMPSSKRARSSIAPTPFFKIGRAHV